MRFDDSLETVLSADMSTPFGAQSAWRQLVDLIGRGRAGAGPETMARLRVLRDAVPVTVRAASARALAAAEPPAALVRLFAEDDAAVAAPVLRAARLDEHAWIALLPGLSSVARSVLRHRRDLPVGVTRALEAFGSVDFVLDASPEALATVETPRKPVLVARAPDPEAVAEPEPARETSFASIASIAHGLPVVAEALRQHNAPPAPTADGTFEIADLVARLDAFHRERDENGAPAQAEMFDLPTIDARAFQFETDASGTIRWVEGVSRAPLIGLSLDQIGEGAAIDGVASGAFRRRSGFANARLVVAGTSDAAGQWRISAMPVFDRASGRFTGYRGSARRPRVEESAELSRDRGRAGPDALRQLVHELRTPANAIAGFAEMIESEMLGPVPPVYRGRAGAIRDQVHALLGAIDDIDMAARIDTRALDLRQDAVPLAPLLARIVGDLAPLADLRSATIDCRAAPDLVIAGDDRAVERLIGRLFATLLASAQAGERIGVTARIEDAQAVIVFDRPRALVAYPADGLLRIDAETEAEQAGAPLLGTGFALRLARNLAGELGGSLTLGDAVLTLRLPAVVSAGMEQAFSS
ncbi:HAMP domain-containing sensor histidine kinase [Sphingomonas pollutisoli]|uniref:sensor histidine kinase n=1 Tax=Sphingomonas pollutisoli TaxID=3030829 RepID=UPI0030B7F665